MATIGEQLLTAEEYFHLPTPDRPTELVRGEIVETNQPGFQHGEVCGNIVFILRSYLQKHPIGRVVSNDAGIITTRDPDTVRGGDIAYYSFERLPKEKTPVGYPAAQPELVFEVRSPSNRWSDVLEKVAECLAMGVTRVVVVDAESESAHVYAQDHPVVVLQADNALTLEDILPGFSVSVSELLQT